MIAASLSAITPSFSSHNAAKCWAMLAVRCRVAAREAMSDMSVIWAILCYPYGMKFWVILLVLAVILLSACRDDDSATEQSTETEQSTVVDCEETPDFPECEFSEPDLPPIPPIPFLNK